MEIGKVARRCAVIWQGETGGYMIEVGRYTAIGIAVDVHKLVFPDWPSAGMALIDFFEPPAEGEERT